MDEQDFSIEMLEMQLPFKHYKMPKVYNMLWAQV